MRYNSNKLRRDLITKRKIDNNMPMRTASKEIGISNGTLSRLENAKIPDVETFAKVVKWLGTQPNDYFVI